MQAIDDPRLLIRLYTEMFRIRCVEETIAERYREQEMRCPVHLSIGQEAVAVGVCQALSREDYVLSGHRCHAQYLAKGGNLRAMVAELYGRVTGCCKGKGGSMHLVDRSAGFLGAAPIVGSTIPIAVGAAFGRVMIGDANITAIFFGDGATEEGVFHESLNFASLKSLPVLFVCENNFYSVYSPLSVRQPASRDTAMIARGHGLNSISGDGNNVIEVYNLAARAVSQMREKSSPVILELTTYRWREHCGPNFDNDIGYRTEEEFNSWRDKCPVRRLEAQLLDAGILSDGSLEEIRQRIKVEIEAAFDFARSSPFPDKHCLLAEVYAS